MVTDAVSVATSWLCLATPGQTPRAATLQANKKSMPGLRREPSGNLPSACPEPAKSAPTARLPPLPPPLCRRRCSQAAQHNPSSRARTHVGGRPAVRAARRPRRSGRAPGSPSPRRPAPPQLKRHQERSLREASGEPAPARACVHASTHASAFKRWQTLEFAERRLTRPETIPRSTFQALVVCILGVSRFACPRPSTHPHSWSLTSKFADIADTRALPTLTHVMVCHSARCAAHATKKHQLCPQPMLGG